MSQSSSRPWEEFVPRDELDQLAALGFGERQTPGHSPCLVVVDVVMSFLGPRPGSDEPAPRTACGPMGWERLPTIARLVDSARAAGVPVVFTKGDVQDKTFCGGSMKTTRDPSVSRTVHSAPFPDELVPRADEYVLSKPKPSAFFQAPLALYLIRNGIDTLILAGTTTSGCIRATAVDASAYNFKVFVVEDACFDRSRFAHAANLFDIQMKYGDVICADEAEATFMPVAATAAEPA